MRYNIIHPLFCTLILLPTGFLAACSLPPGSSSHPRASISNKTQTNFMDFPWTGSREERIRYAREKILKKTPYLGPIQVQVIPGLANQSPSSIKKLVRGFTVQSSPAGSTVFQETFTKVQEDLDEIRSFQISNTASRYTLHVQKQSGAQQDTQVEININGTNWIKAQDFTDQNQTVQKDSLLLNVRNSLRVRLKGGTGTSVTISISEGGQAGTVLYSQTRLALPGDNQLTHTTRNDINIFEAGDLSSLGGLTPYQGERVDGQGNHIGAVQFNQEDKLEFASGILILEFVNRQTGLDIFRQLYGAEVLEQNDQRYLLKLDLTKAPVQQLPELLRAYNQSIPGNIQQLAFGSLASLQTFAIFMDVAVHHADLLKDLELNGLLYSQQAASPVCSSPPLQDWEYIDTNLGKSWWLVDTHVGAPLWNPFAPTSTPEYPYASGAWDYSIGTGVTVAVIDSGFRTSHREIKRRTSISAELGNNSGTNNPGTVIVQGSSAVDPDHGHQVVMTGFAEKDNSFGTSGVAPNAKVIMYSLQNGGAYWELETYVKEAAKHADVLSISLSGKDNTAYTFGLFGSFTGQGLMDRITEAVNAGKVVVVSAGNSQSNYTGYIPAKHPLAITVGAVDSDTSPNARLGNNVVGTSMFNPYWCAQIPGPTLANPNPEKLTVASFSNFGPEHSLVWAPGNWIKIQKKANNVSMDIEDFSGTSAAAPFVSALVALMKSRNPGLTPAAIKTILTDQARGALVKASTDMTRTGIPDTQIVDAEKALQLAGATKKAVTYMALVDSEPNFSYRDENNLVLPGRKLRLNQFVQSDSPPTEREKQVPEQTVSYEAFKRMDIGKVVRVKGWSDVTTGREDTGNGIHNIHVDKSQIEISEVEEICDFNQPTTCAQTNIKPDLRPEIHAITFGPLNGSTTPGYLPSSSAGFKMRIQGKNLIAILNGSEDLRFLILYAPFSPETGFGAPVQLSAVSQSEIESIANDGSEVLIRMPAYAPTTASGFGKGLPPGNFALSLAGLTPTELFHSDSGLAILASDTGNDGGDFHINLADTPPSDPASPPPLPPSYISLWLLRDTKRLPVSPDHLVGIAINDQDLSQLEIEVVKGDQHIRANVVEVAQNFAAFQIPPDAQAGVQSILLKIGANRELLQDAIDVQPAGPVTLFWDKRDIYTNGLDSSKLTIRLRQADGSPAPDGALYYVFPSGDTSTHYDFADPVYQPFPERPFVDRMAKVHDGKIELTVTSSRKIPPGEYPVNSNWPSPGHPALEIVDVCEPNYSSYSGWFCARSLGSLETQPRLYLKDIFSVVGPSDILEVEAGGHSVNFKVHFFDRAGLPVPNGTPIFIAAANPYGETWAHAPVTTENELEITYTSGPKSCYGGGGSYDGISFKGIYFDYSQYAFGGVEPIFVKPYDKCPGY